MKEYIERASVHSIIERTSTFAFTRGGMHEKIDSLPAADVVEVRHGYWYDCGSLSCRCSECGCKNNRETAYCPACGARMDKENEHEIS